MSNNIGGGIIIKKTSLGQFPKSIPNPQTIPILILESLDSTFTTKKCDLYSPVKIGRKVKAAPLSSNGVFDSKVLSRAHCEIYYSDGKVLIMDVKSSNGTFVNGDRLR
jgi:pSer/pThr/pTyr-binding forkhead associated (FHA) protein